MHACMHIRVHSYVSINVAEHHAGDGRSKCLLKLLTLKFKFLEESVKLNSKQLDCKLGLAYIQPLSLSCSTTDWHVKMY